MKEKTILLSEYFKLVKPKYKYIQITPHKSIRNYNSSNIAKCIAHTYRAINRRIYKKQKTLFFETNFKISYIIDITNSNANFYFLVPEVFMNTILIKIKEVWAKATINILECGLDPFSDKAEIYQLAYKKEDALSLYCDRKSNEPLNSILSVMEIMKEENGVEDRVCICYNFKPQSQLGWLERYTDTMNKIKEKKCIDKKNMTLEYAMKSTILFAVNTLDSVMQVINDFTGGNPNQDRENLYLSVLGVLEQQKDLSSSTKNKKEQTVLQTEIAIITDSLDDTRRENNAIGVCQSYRVLDEDNELIYSKVKKKEPINLEKYNLGCKNNTFSTNEISSFIQIPGRTLLNYFNIKHINVEEAQVPKQLQKGYLSLGASKYKSEVIESYLEDEYNISQLPLLEIGNQGAGKSTYMANYYRFANIRKEGGVVIDFIKNCEMTDEIIKYVPEEDLIILDYTSPDCIQGFAFNEFDISKITHVYKRLEIVNKQAQQVLSFVDSINITQPLQARMRKYLSGASNVVFATGETSLKEVIKCLESHQVRANYVNKLSLEEKEYLEDEIKYLDELDEWSRPKKDEVSNVIGTHDSKIDGILDRVSLLREDFKLKNMFNKGSKGNINFAEELERGKLIIIRMPQDSFKKHAKNVIVTFLVSKIWIATEIRGSLNKQPKKTHIAIDEVFQCKTAMKMIADEEMLPQTRKFGCKFIFSCQYIFQIDIILDTLINAGASVMLMSGTSEEDFKYFKPKIDNFEYEDLRDMERYSSLNVIKYSKGYSSFITKLPKPI